MATALSIFGVAFTAFCVWLTVRIFNRRERWAIWTLALTIGLPAIYVASFGPACWITAQPSLFHPGTIPHNPAMIVYCPLAALGRYGDEATRDKVGWWMTYRIPHGRSAVVPTNPIATEFFVVQH